MEHQSASSCCACWSVVVRRTRRHRKSCPYVCWVSSHTPPRHGHDCALSIFGRTSRHSWLIALAVTADLHSTCQLGLPSHAHCICCTAVDRCQLEVAPGSGCGFAPRLRWLCLRLARGVFVALQHLITDHRELQQHLLGGSRRRFVRASALSAVQDRALIGVQFPLVLMPPVLLHPAITRVLRSRLAKRCRSVHG